MIAAFGHVMFAQAGITQQAYLKASNPDVADNFGYAVSISGDIAVVGAPYEWGGSAGVNGNQAQRTKPGAGAAYIFVRHGSTWVQEAYLKASNPKKDDNFGAAVAVSGTTVIVGAPGENSDSTGINGNQNNVGAVNSGAVYIFVKQGGEWMQQAFVKASNTMEFAAFGRVLALEGETAVVCGGGAAYVFARSGGEWTQQAYLRSSNFETQDGFGGSVALSQNTLIVGANQEQSGAKGVNGNQNDNSTDGAGAAYVFVRTGTSWSQQAYLKASNTSLLDYFGDKVAISGDIAVVGAYREDSNATGVNGNQASNSIPDSGAAYVFSRSGSVWTQQGYLKSSNPGPSDYFGSSVAVSNECIVVGAWGESSNARGINGSQGNNDANDAGAAYYFTRSNGTWVQRSYLKASNTLVTDSYGDYFGRAIALSGSTVLIGAFREDGGSSGVGGDQFDRSLSSSGAVYVFTGAGADAPDISVQSPAGVELTSGQSSIDFGTTATMAGVVRSFTVKNVGEATLAGIGLTIDGDNAADFIVTKPPAATSLPVNATTAFEVTCSPTAIGVRNAILHVTSNDPDESPFDVALTGSGAPGTAFQEALKFVDEGGAFQIALVRTGDTSGAASVVVNSIPGTAGTEDFTPLANVVVNFGEGESTAAVPIITVKPDNVAESNEHFALKLSNPQGGIALGNPATMTVRIIDSIDATKPGVSISSPAANSSFNEGASVHLTGSAMDNKGVRKVQFSLNNAAFTDAELILNAAGTGAAYTMALAPLLRGPNTVSVKCIDTRGNESATVTRAFKFIVKRPLTVNKTGSGTLPKPFPGVDETKQVGFAYTLKATPGAGQVFNGWGVENPTGTQITAAMREQPILTFIHQEDLVLTANFISNPFTSPIIGKFDGLAQPSAGVPVGGTRSSNETVGGFTASITNTGSFTGTLRQDGLSLGMKGVFDNAGVARFGAGLARSVQLPRPGKPPLEVALMLDMTGTTSVITGTAVVRARSGAVIAQSDITADRTPYSSAMKAPAAIAGTTLKAFTLVFKHQAPPPGWTAADLPGGDGFATGTIKSDGTVTFSGKLADASAISVSTTLSKAHTWPWFSQLYAKGGSFTAQVAVDTTAPNSDLTASGAHWFRPWQNVQWYPWGWMEGIRVEVLGAAYIPPALSGLTPADPLLGNATLQWSNGLLASSVVKGVNVDPTTSMITPAPKNENSFTVGLIPATGALSGMFTHTDGTKPAWQGVLVQKGASKGGYGFFMTVVPKVMNGTGESGNVKLQMK